MSVFENDKNDNKNNNKNISSTSSSSSNNNNSKQNQFHIDFMVAKLLKTKQNYTQNLATPALTSTDWACYCAVISSSQSSNRCYSLCITELKEKQLEDKDYFCNM
ncbi:hypothetical protein GQX74_000710 [Glossina fuscipes]|nr:hypothetical protein GQX74_000710 [Glossina fuscipes]